MKFSRWILEFEGRKAKEPDCGICMFKRTYGERTPGKEMKNNRREGEMRTKKKKNKQMQWQPSQRELWFASLHG
jgi:hypothetical protein